MDDTTMARALDALQTRWPDWTPDCGLVLGSGWGAVTEAFTCEDAVPYDTIPGLGPTSVQGHAGRLVRAHAAGLETLIFQGRRHWYEGADWTPVILPVYLLKQLGARILMLTNAAGGIHPDFAPGDLMVIEDHINHFRTNPLIGRHRAVWGERFPDMSVVYDAALRAALHAAGDAADEALRRGVYLALPGPCYETPAEIRAYRTLGADAVGMSTVPEAMVAHAAGLRVVGLSCITNLAAGVSSAPLSHDEVADTAARALPRMHALLPQAWEAFAVALNGGVPDA